MDQKSGEQEQNPFGWDNGEPPESALPAADESAPDPFGLRKDPYSGVDPDLLRPVSESVRAARLLNDEPTFRRTHTFGDLLGPTFDDTGSDTLLGAHLPEVAAVFSERFPGVEQETLETYVDFDGALFACGLPDVDLRMVKTVANEKKVTLARMLHDQRMFETGTFTSHANRPAILKPGVKQQRGQLSLEQLLRQPESRELITGVEDQNGRGFFRSPTLGMPFMSMNFIYAPEMPRMEASPNFDVAAVGMSVADKELLFPGEFTSTRQGVSFTEVARALRERVGVDLSKELLDARIESLAAAVHIETAGMALQDLADLAKLGGQRTAKAVELYKRFGKHLLEPSNTATGDLLHEIAKYTSGLSKNMNERQNPLAKRVLAGMSQRSMQVRGHLYQSGPSFTHIYKTFGWPLPKQLATPPTEEAGTPPLQDEVTDTPNTPDVPEVTETTPRETVLPPTEVEPEAIAVSGVADEVTKEQLRRAIITQLDEIILPTESNGLTGEEFTGRMREAVDKMASETPGASGDVMWERLNDLVTLSNEYGGTVYKSKKGTLGGKLPYFVCVFDYEGDTVAVAETPLRENATYIVAEGKAAGTWLEVLTLSREDARDVGAARKYHAGAAPHGEGHLRKIRALIDELTLT